MTWKLHGDLDRWSLEPDDGSGSIDVRRDGAAWRVDWPGNGAATLEALERGGFRGVAGDRRELAISSPPLGMERDTRLRHVLLDDGRAYRIARCGGTHTGFDVRGWETPGAYLEARHDGEVWRLTATAAGADLNGLAALALLVGMEIVDACASRTGTT